MDPTTTALAQLGGGFALAVAILLLHRESLKAFREEMSTERTRNDTNLTRFFDKMDKLTIAFEAAKCRAPQTEAEVRAFIASLTYHAKQTEKRIERLEDRP